MVGVRRAVFVLLAAAVVASVAAPRAMLGPGDLLEGHRDLETGCFSCHTPFRGPDARCLACHETARIDADATDRPPFHAALAEPRCSACHTDHAGRSAARAVREFRHALLRDDIRETCGACHRAPADDLHRGAAADSCATCHDPREWTPSTFDHAPLFRFDRDHPADCRRCHEAGFAAYTCYGCHEHRPDEVERKHRKEGIDDFADCAPCHRSADEDDSGRRRRGRDR
jgi:hypothetical protein